MPLSPACCGRLQLEVSYLATIVELVKQLVIDPTDSGSRFSWWLLTIEVSMKQIGNYCSSRNSQFIVHVCCELVFSMVHVFCVPELCSVVLNLQLLSLNFQQLFLILGSDQVAGHYYVARRQVEDCRMVNRYTYTLAANTK